ncbi:MAG: hypothetical protein ACYDCO_20755 [Armatimonadota bacterium]
MDDLLRVLGVQDKEDIITNLLAYGINTDLGFARIFLSAVCGSVSPYTQARAETRIAIPGLGVPDLAIVATDGSAYDLFVIENKVKADEGNDQTERYEKCFATLKARLISHSTARSTTGIFLTLFPDVHPCNPNFRTATYADLLDGLKTYTGGHDALLDALLASLRVQYSAFYSAAHVSSTDRVLERLSIQDNLGAGFLVFRQLFDGITYPHGLALEYSNRVSQSGRHYYLAQISKDAWHPEEMAEAHGRRRVRLNPNTCFSIHLEPQFDAINGCLSVQLHYEVNPYQPEKWVLHHVNEDDYAGYLERRQRCQAFLAQASISGLTFGGRVNQIGKIAIPVDDNTTIDEFRTVLLTAITPVVEAIETFLQRETASTHDNGMSPPLVRDQGS